MIEYYEFLNLVKELEEIKGYILEVGNRKLREGLVVYKSMLFKEKLSNYLWKI